MPLTFRKVSSLLSAHHAIIILDEGQRIDNPKRGLSYGVFFLNIVAAISTFTVSAR
jgi:hypothetical protein